MQFITKKEEISDWFGLKSHYEKNVEILLKILFKIYLKILVKTWIL